LTLISNGSNGSNIPNEEYFELRMKRRQIQNSLRLAAGQAGLRCVSLHGALNSNYEWFEYSEFLCACLPDSQVFASSLRFTSLRAYF
jgi:hypothetical protein